MYIFWCIFGKYIQNKCMGNHLSDEGTSASWLAAWMAQIYVHLCGQASGVCARPTEGPLWRL